MDTRVSRHYTHDIHQPSTPDKEVDREKKTPGGRGGEGRGGEGKGKGKGKGGFQNGDKFESLSMLGY